MKQCWRCRTTSEPTGIHHIDGNHDNQKPQNLLRLCQKCHDFIQGICDKCASQKDCHIQKLQRCWMFENALPPIYFREKSNGEGYDSHPEPLKQEILNNIQNLVKIGHRIESSIITETYKNSTIFLEHFVKCDYCGDWIRWKLGKGMERLICANCLIRASGSPRQKQIRKRKQGMKELLHEQKK